MSKTKRSFVRDEYDEDDGDSFRLHEEKMARRKERLLEQALKTKNIEAFIPEYDIILDAIDEGFEEGWTMEEEDYVSCVSCGKVFITEEDYKGAEHYFQHENHKGGENSPEISEWTCLNCVQNPEED